MKPYFDTSHAAGALLLIAVLGWAMIEISHLGHSRQGATHVGGAGRRYAAWPFLVAASVMLYLAASLTAPTPRTTSAWSRSSGNTCHVMQ